MFWWFIACTENQSEEYFRHLLYTFRYERAEGALSKGFNLDTYISTSQEPNGCYHQDFTHPEGHLGIDNNFATIIDDLAATEAEDIEYSFDEAVRDGLLLIIIERKGIGDNAEIRIRYGSEAPYLSAQGDPLDGQSFSIDETTPSSSWFPARYSGTSYTIEGFEILVQSEIMSVPISLPLTNASLQIPAEDTDFEKGIFAGGLALSDALILTSFDLVGMTEMLEYRLASHLDLYPDEQGACQSISTTFSFSAIPVHLFSSEE